MKQWIINKTITITSINVLFLPNSGKLGSPRSLSASPRSRVSFTSATDRLYSLPTRNFHGAPKDVFTSEPIIQCVWLILSRWFASRPESPTRLAPSQALAVRPVLIQWSVSYVGVKLFRSFSYCAVMVNKYPLRQQHVQHLLWAGWVPNHDV